MKWEEKRETMREWERQIEILDKDKDFGGGEGGRKRGLIKKEIINYKRSTFKRAELPINFALILMALAYDQKLPLGCYY